VTSEIISLDCRFPFFIEGITLPDIYTPSCQFSFCFIRCSDYCSISWGCLDPNKSLVLVGRWAKPSHGK